MNEKVRKAVLIGIVVVLAIILAGVLFWKNSQTPSESNLSNTVPTDQNQTDNQQNNQEQTETQPNDNTKFDEAEQVSTEDWETYTDDKLGFSIQHPPNAKISSATKKPTTKDIKPPHKRIFRTISVFGENEDPTSNELIDGFSLYISQEKDGSSYSSLEEYGQSFVTDANRTRPQITTIRDKGIISFTDKKAYKYVITSQQQSSGTAYYIFLPENTNYGYKVSVDLEDPNQNGYSDITSTMIDTLNFQP